MHDFTNRAELDSHALANSGAKVEVYLGTKRIETYHVPASGVGNVWHVFDFDSDNQQLIPVNEFSSESDASMVGAEIAHLVRKNHFRQIRRHRITRKTAQRIIQKTM